MAEGLVTECQTQGSAAAIHYDMPFPKYLFLDYLSVDPILPDKRLRSG
jgi:hypothetical protein